MNGNVVLVHTLARGDLDHWSLYGWYFYESQLMTSILVGDSDAIVSICGIGSKLYISM